MLVYDGEGWGIDRFFFGFREVLFSRKIGFKRLVGDG